MTKRSATSIVYEVLRDQVVDNDEFTSLELAKLVKDSGHDVPLNNVSSSLSSFVRRDGLTVIGQRDKLLVYQKTEGFSNLNIKLQSSGGGAGSQGPRKFKNYPKIDDTPLHEKLLSLAAEVEAIELKAKGPIDLSKVPDDDLLAEMQRRMHGKKNGRS